jgi:hypothetical protein
MPPLSEGEAGVFLKVIARIALTKTGRHLICVDTALGY